jgi:hypothetical protein
LCQALFRYDVRRADAGSRNFGDYPHNGGRVCARGRVPSEVIANYGFYHCTIYRWLKAGRGVATDSTA